MAKDITDHGGAINGRRLDRTVHSEDPLGGTGGSDGGGTGAGEGDPSGADADAPRLKQAADDLSPDGAIFAAAGELAGKAGSEAAAEAAALGPSRVPLAEELARAADQKSSDRQD